MGRESELTDAQVIARSVREPGAFRSIFDRHFADVHRYGRTGRGPPRRLGDGQDIVAFDPGRATLIALGASDAPHSTEIRWSTLYAVRSAEVDKVGERPRR